MKHQSDLNQYHLGKYGTYDFFYFHNIESVREYWNYLNQDNLCSPFQRYSWAQSIVAGEKQFAQSNDMQPADYLFIVGFVEGKPVLILPFEIQDGFLGSRLAWLGEKKSDYNSVVFDCRQYAAVPAEFINRVLRMVHQKFPSVHAASLIRNLDNTLKKQDDLDIGTQQLTAEYSSHALKLQRDWKKLFSEVRSSKSRQRLRAKLRTLKKAGDVKFCRIRTKSQRAQEAERILQWKSSQLDKNGSRNPFHNDDQPSALHITINTSLASQDPSLQVFGLYLNGQMIAGMLAFVTKETFYYYVTAFSDDVGKKYSAGTILLVKTLELASRTGIKQYDFLIGDEPYKSDWCNTRIPLVHYNRALSIRGLLICQAIGLRLAIKKYLLRHPRLVYWVKFGLKHFHSLRKNQTLAPPNTAEIAQKIGRVEKTRDAGVN